MEGKSLRIANGKNQKVIGMEKEKEKEKERKEKKDYPSSFLSLSLLFIRTALLSSLNCCLHHSSVRSTNGRSKLV